MLICTLISKGPPVIQFPGHAPPPTSFGAPPGTPSAPGAASAPMAPPYPQSGDIGFPNSNPVSFGMPQPYGYPQNPYSMPPRHPTGGQWPIPTPGARYQPISQPVSSYMPPQPQQPYLNEPSSYPQQQNYNLYPNFQNAPEAKECFCSPSPYTSAATTYSNNAGPYQGGSYPGGQGAGFYSPHEGRSTSLYRPHSAPAPAPRRNQFTPKVRLKESVTEAKT